MESKKLGFGLMRLPLTEKDNQESIDMEQLNKMVDTFIERGFTYFDTAYMYHNFQSEIVLREALVKRHDRSSFTVATKMPTMFLKTKEDQERIFNEQLEKCGEEYFDYYLLHNHSPFFLIFKFSFSILYCYSPPPFLIFPDAACANFILHL